MFTALLVVVVLAPVAYSLYKGYEAYRQIARPGEFFLYPKEFAAERLRNSITASNISLGAAIFAFLSFGYTFRVGALVAPLTWLPGFLLLVYLFPRIPELASGRTLHGYLSHKYGSLTLGYIASLASVVGFLGAYGVEVLVAIKLFGAFFRGQTSDVVLAFSIAVVVTAYTALGGFKAASHADGMRLAGTTVGILVAIGYALYIVLTSTAPNQTEILQSVRADGLGVLSLTPLFLCSLILLNVPWQLVDMSVWQRLSACEKPDDIKKGIRQSIPFIGILWVLLIGLGILLHFFPGFSPPANGDFATAFLSYLKNPLVLAVFVAACIAALMSTADSLLIASVQTLVMDVFFPHKEPHVLFSSQSATENPELAARLLSTGRKWVWILGLTAPVFIYSLNVVIPGILDLLFLIYSAQLALLATVSVAVFSKKPIKDKNKVAIASVGVGVAVAFTMFGVMLVRPSMHVFLLAPILSVGASLLPWLAVLFMGTSEERKA